MPRGKGYRLSYQDAKAIETLIADNATISQATDVKDRLVSYNPNWDDERVAAEASKQLGATIGFDAVRRFRKSQIGLVARGGSKARCSAPPIMTSLALLKRQNSVLEERLANIEEFLIERHKYRPPTPRLDHLRAIESVEDVEHVE